MKKKITAILQARMGSKRLPGKIMKKVGTNYIFELIVKRLKKSKQIDEIVVATSTKKGNDIFVNELKNLKIKFFRGNENDVIKRYYYAAKKFNAGIIIRITCDCPFVDPAIVDKFIQRLKKKKLDYISNCFPYTFPNGLDTEVFKFSFLENVFNNAKQRHKKKGGVVLRYLKENLKKTKYENISSGIKNFNNIRLALDTKKDLKFVKKIYENFYPDIYFDYKKIISFLKKNKNLLKINT